MYDYKKYQINYEDYAYYKLRRAQINKNTTNYLLAPILPTFKNINLIRYVAQINLIILSENCIFLWL